MFVFGNLILFLVYPNQFFIFLIWLNFGRVAVNPFGTDEDDIDVKLLLETHIQVFIFKSLDQSSPIAGIN